MQEESRSAQNTLEGREFDFEVQLELQLPSLLRQNSFRDHCCARIASEITAAPE
jgi:hypothetical protein